MSYPVSGVGSIGPEAVAKLKAIRVRTTATVLERASTPKGRKTLAAEAGLDETVILKLANIADLTRVPGIALDYAELLEAAGVDTVPDLRSRNPANLARLVARLNQNHKIVQVPPSEKMLAKWIERARALPVKMTY
ncbi:DUF4332 domain-containing protein [Hansschlegelia sp.]|uniref:DUF4332 domain-containing protein n=1 Tax=Hansschlegelia sp. TaxID=2041892 RepID=UPI002BC5CC19|nr:DUF4332 domain-containing protein [Hansschlegelia sp.]HVI28133.1 DUF4332 domain-containing protein [Hansschlegelia sp.]